MPRAGGSSSGSSSRRPQPSRREAPLRPQKRHLPGPVHDNDLIQSQYALPGLNLDDPKYTIANARYSSHVNSEQGLLEGRLRWRSKATVNVEPPILGLGDHEDKKQSQFLAYLSAAYQLYNKGFLFMDEVKSTTLKDGTEVTAEQARNFMDFYCRRFKFGAPVIDSAEVPGGWESTMLVGGRRIGVGNASSKKASINQSYLDVVQYIDSCDPSLWKDFTKLSSKGDLPGYVPDIFYTSSPTLTRSIRDLCVDLKRSNLYQNRPREDVTASVSLTQRAYSGPHASPFLIRTKSSQLQRRRQEYLNDPRVETIRTARTQLPVFTRVDDILQTVEKNDVTILMAATGSGKTTQIPQILLDSWIERGNGAECNILCTQPRRLAALSVADRVSKERGETLGKSVGYQVRFESKMPEDHGSITFCTTGIFLKRLQSELEAGAGQRGPLDNVTHVVVDEVHERDVDTDLVLVVLKRWLRMRKAQNKPIKVVLMSATIDPTLFQRYFPDDNGNPAQVLDIPGRSYPVQKYFMDDFLQEISKSRQRWVLQDDSVARYVGAEMGSDYFTRLVGRPPSAFSKRDTNTAPKSSDELEIPYALIAATISFVLQKSDSGHVLAFLPGWDDITSVQKILQRPDGPLGIDFNDRSKIHMHILHSSIPLAEQQAIFEPPPPGVRRVILATNIAETSVTIPDVVYVVDTARLKEQRYDPEKHIMSLVSAWVGSSNLNQRAGRAGRHRPGDYYGVLSKSRADSLQPYQTVEMSRVDLTNVVMHIKALNFPGMSVEDVLAEAIEPPLPDRVGAAVTDLQMVGALDNRKNLTSLGRVLLQLPVDVQVGRLVLYGSFFKCLDQSLTLAAILTNRDPFVTPMHLKEQAREARLKWLPSNFKSDPLSVLNAYNAWEDLQKTSRNLANQFCIDNFLAKPTLLMIMKIKGHLLQSLYRAGVLHVSGGGVMDDRSLGQMPRQLEVPQELNENGNSLSLLAALIALASQPKFAIRFGERIYRTQQDKVTMIHPSSVNHRKFETSLTDDKTVKQVIAYSEKRQNVSVATQGTPATFLVTTTRIDPLIYLLFGAHNVEQTSKGIKCDDWINIVGHLDGLDDLTQLKDLLDGAMKRVYEGLIMSGREQRGKLRGIREEVEEEAWDDDDGKDYSLSKDEVKELDLMSRDLVSILEAYAQERISAPSRTVSRPATPSSSNSRIAASTQGTPYGSRAGTPLSRMRRW